MQAARTAIISAQLTFLARVCSELSWSAGALLEDAEGQAQLHAAVSPLAATAREHYHRCGADCSAAGAECQGAAEPARASAVAALLACLRSPSAPFEAVQLCVAALARAWGCARGGGAAAAALCDALAAPAAGEGGGSSSNALPAAISSGIVGLLNALSGGGGGGEGTLLSDGLPPLPVAPPALLACVAGFLVAALEHAAAGADGGGGGGGAAAAAEAGLPSPLVARAGAGVRPLYASDARVAIDLALRGSEDAEGAAERLCWVRVLRALSAHADASYRRAEVEAAAGLGDDL